MACKMEGLRKRGAWSRWEKGSCELSYESWASVDQVSYPGQVRSPSQPVQPAYVDQGGETSMSSVLQAWYPGAVWAAARRCLERVDVDGGMTRSGRAWRSQSLRTYCSLGRSLGRGLWEEVKCLQVEVSCRGFTEGNVWCWQTPNAQRFQEHHWWCVQERSQMKPFSSAPHFNIQHLVLPHIYALLSRCQEYKCTITKKTDLQNCIPPKYKKKELKKVNINYDTDNKMYLHTKRVFFLKNCWI